MNCVIAQQLLQPYLDHELEAAEARALEHHVAGCAECRGEFVQLERTLLALESLSRPSAPLQLYADTMAQIERAHPPVSPEAVPQPLANGVLALVAVVGLFFAQSSTLDVSSAWISLEEEGLSGVVNGAMFLAVSSELSFITGLGLLLAACSISLLQIMVRHQSTS